MKGKKVLFLFLALLLPILVFLFLKIFGKNEFAVQPLYSDVMPEIQSNCNLVVTIPYHVPDSVMQQLNFTNDSLTLIWFGRFAPNGIKQHRRVKDAFKSDPLNQIELDDKKYEKWRKCIFFLKGSFDVVLIDKRGLIRGQYVSEDREEIDRLMIEIDIILKKY